MASQLQLTKQMQYVVLGVILGGFALFAVINYMVAPMIRDRRADQEQTREIQTKLEEQRRVIKTRRHAQQQLNEAQAQIVKLSAYIPLPVLGNLLLGMEDTIRTCAKGLDIEISQVTHQDILELEGSGFSVYRVRVTAQAGFRAVTRLFQVLQENNPLVSVSGLTMVPRVDNFEKHDVTFTVAWLIWADPAKRPDFLMDIQAQEPAAPSRENKKSP